MLKLSRRDALRQTAAFAVVGAVGLSRFGNAAAQDGPTFTFANGSILTWAKPWKRDEEATGPSAELGGEIVTLLNGATGRMRVATSPSILTPIEARDSLIAKYKRTSVAYALVESDQDDTGAYAIQIFSSETDEEMGSLASWSPSADGAALLGFEVLAPITEFEKILGDVQTGVSLDDIFIYGDVDASAIAIAMAGATLVPVARVSDGGSATPDEETPAPAGDTGFEDVGLVKEGVYESPQFGYAVTWGKPWTLNPDDDEAVISDTSSKIDGLFLSTTDPTYSLVSVTGSTSDGQTVADVVDKWSSRDFLDVQTGPGTEVVLSKSKASGGAVVTFGAFDAETDLEVVTVREVVPLDDGDTHVFLTLLVSAENFEDIYVSANASINLEKDGVFSFFAVDAIVEALP